MTPTIDPSTQATGQPPVTAHHPRAAINRANAQHSTGPRSVIGKQHSALNAITHGLTSQSPVLPAEDPAAFNRHAQDLFHEYKPKTPTEKQLVKELADTSWRMNRIPFLERDILMLSATLPAGSINVDLPDLQTCRAVQDALRPQERLLANLKIGRASCRERV